MKGKSGAWMHKNAREKKLILAHRVHKVLGTKGT